MIEETGVWLSLLIIFFCVIAFFFYDTYFYEWGQCERLANDITDDNIFHYPFIDGKCCQYKLNGTDIKCN